MIFLVIGIYFIFRNYPGRMVSIKCNIHDVNSGSAVGHTLIKGKGFIISQTPEKSLLLRIGPSA